MTTADDVLAELDRLRDRRLAKFVSEAVYHEEQERLWQQLREIDRLEKQRREELARIEQEQLKQKRRDQRIARSQRKLAALLAQPPRTTVASLRQWLEEFTKLDSTNQPELRARQQRVTERLNRLSESVQARSVPKKPQLSNNERLFRRAKASGDALKAVEIARRFHKFVRPLYVSKRATIQFGAGGERETVWRSRRYPTVWQNAGVWIDYAARQIVFKNHKGEEKSRLPLPPLKLVTFDGLEDGDLWGIVSPLTPSIVERWGLDSIGLTVKRGYAQR